MRSRNSIHHEIKECLGYDPKAPDAEVRKDWRERTSRVCKPCWELKYCPYGPLVEQLPLLPLTRASVNDHNAYLQECLDTGLTGQIEVLTEERRKEIKSWLKDEELLFVQALHQLQRKKWSKKDIALLNGPLPPPHIYRARFDMIDARPKSLADLPREVRPEVRKQISEIKSNYRKALKTGQIDDREPITKSRRAYFRKTIKESASRDLPDEIPAEFQAASCNVFGHICPVFFAAEAFTETAAERRIGNRYISHAMRMRIVRRDNYICQECSTHLRDDEVEFDHIIPLSRGGSTEEHNLRLTCFDCNRDKSDDFSPLSIAERVRPSKGRRVQKRRPSSNNSDA